MIVRNVGQLLSVHLRTACVARGLCTKVQSSPAATEKWDLYSGVLLERLPIIGKPLDDVQTRVQNLMNQIEFENSLRSDHELRKERDAIQAKLLAKGEIDVDLDATKQTAQDFEDACNEELEKFQMASRTTAADKKNDVKSLNRKLDETLIFIAKQNLGKTQVTCLPQGKWIEGETLRQTAERVLKEIAGDKVKAQFYGNAPCGFYKYKYPKGERGESVGAKVFFFRAVLRDHKDGNVDAKTAFEWRTKEELGTVLKSQSYYKSVSQFML
ncbi:large ribosomal subunit protein mL46 [Culicoides brevitarsis]|uniref:large ribosomal subunit protein mL46 n=1 Tax=Culicoides brevitarsis TaxID=469753 RepID=UPI00307C37F5